MLNEHTDRFHYKQKISLRLYNYPQRTDKQSFYRYHQILFLYMNKLTGINSRKRPSIRIGYDDQRGEYQEIRGVFAATNKDNKHRIIWLNARG